MNTYQYTAEEYIAAIQREQAKRATTYPKIIAKMTKKGEDEAEIKKAFYAQCSQSALLSMALDTFCGNHSKEETPYYAILTELVREYKMRRKCYERFVMFKRMTEETARYEKWIWRELCFFFAETYMGDAQIAVCAGIIVGSRKRKFQTEPC